MQVVFWSGASEGLHLAIQCLLRNPALLRKNSGDKKLYLFIQKEFPCLENTAGLTQKKCLFNNLSPASIKMVIQIPLEILAG